MGWGGWGGYPSQVQMGGPLPGPVGDPCQEVPCLDYLPSDLAGGIYPCQGDPTSGTPCQTLLGRGYPTLGTPHWTWRGGAGVPLTRGVSHLGYPPVRPGLGGVSPIRPSQGGTPPRVTDRVLDTPRSVCLLRSSWKTFLF